MAFLNPASEAVALARQHVQVIRGEFAPLLPDTAMELFPVAVNAIPVHLCILRDNEKPCGLNATWRYRRCFGFEPMARAGRRLLARVSSDQ